MGSRRIDEKLSFKQRLAAEATQFREAAERERPRHHGAGTALAARSAG